MFGINKQRREIPRHRRLAAECLEPRELLTAVDLTDREQLLLELVNRARNDPMAEAERFEVDLNEGFDPGTISPDPVQPLAPNQILTDTARNHSVDMIEREFFAHENPDGLGPADRARALGYPGTAGENLAWFGTDGLLDRDEEVYNRHEALFLSKEHRKNMLVGGYRELGNGIEYGFLTLGSRSSIVVTENFGNPGGDYFITGVAYTDDIEPDRFYTMGEGLGSVTVTAVRNRDGMTFTTETGDAGGYGLQVPSGVYTVTASNLGNVDPISINEVAILDANQKVDFNTRFTGISTIAGFVFNDLNGNGLTDVGERRLAGQTVFIDVDDNATLSPNESSKVTDEAGDFVFAGLRAGAYSFAVAPDPGWIVTTPTTPTQTIDVIESQLRLNVTFGVQLVNESPVAQDDQFEVDAEQSAQLDVFENDSDDGTLVIEETRISTEPSHGSISLDVSSGKLVYRPDSGFSGSDFFEYAVVDDDGLISEPARVDIEVQPGAGILWQNQDNTMDVNGDTFLSSIDVLLILNDLNANTARQLPFPTDGQSPPPYLDVSGDAFVTPLDALLVLNELNRIAMLEGQAAEGEAESVVEPPAEFSAMTAAAIDLAFDEDELRAKKQ